MEHLVLIVHNHPHMVVPCKKSGPATRKTFHCLPRVCRQIYSETFVLLIQKAKIIFQAGVYTCSSFDYPGHLQTYAAQVLPKSRLDAITSVILNPASALIYDQIPPFSNLQQVEICTDGWNDIDLSLFKPLLPKVVLFR
jgi:hypothetical protein